jgi:hypothetical protein
MITENAWPVHKLQDMTRIPCARRPLSCRSRIPKSRQGCAAGLRIGSRDLPNAGRIRPAPV